MIEKDSISQKNSIEKNFQHFGREHIARYPGLDQLTDFPNDLWREMAKNRLFGIGVDPAYNGHGQSFRALANAGKQLSANGGNMGVAMSWLLHEIVTAWLLSAFGTAVQKKKYLPQLAAGQKIACFAVSEPGVGAHPKHLATTAEKTPDGYVLNGEKTYLTNGPIADIFVVIAITGLLSGRKQFTAFIVSKDTPGFKKTGPLDLPFLHPCPHGGIRLSDCRVTSAQILGDIGDAYEKMVLPFRTVEDTLMSGPVIGGLTFLFDNLINQLSRMSENPDDTIIEEAAQLKCTLDALSIISHAAAKELENDVASDRLLTPGLFFRAQAIEFLEKFKQVFEKTGALADQKTAAMLGDLSAVTRIAENVSKIKLKKLGLSFLSNSGLSRE